jgi:hypothetical protein
MKILKTTGEHAHSNQILERKVREIEEDKMKVVAIISTVSPHTIMGEIAVNLEQMRSTWSRTSLEGPPSCGPGIRFARQSATRGHRPRVSHPSQALEVMPPLLTRTTDDQSFLVINNTVVTGDTMPGWVKEAADLHKPAWERGDGQLLQLVCRQDLQGGIQHPVHTDLLPARPDRDG